MPISDDKVPPRPSDDRERLMLESIAYRWRELPDDGPLVVAAAEQGRLDLDVALKWGSDDVARLLTGV